MSPINTPADKNKISNVNTGYRDGMISAFPICVNLGLPEDCLIMFFSLRRGWGLP